MVIATFLQASDTHDRGNLLDLEAVVNLANEKKPDGVILPGDLFDGGVILGLFKKAEEKLVESFGLTDEEKKWASYSKMHELTEQHGEEKVRTHLQNSGKNKEQTEKILADYETYLKNKEKVAETVQKVHSKFEEKKEDYTKLTTQVITTIAQYFQKADATLKRIKCPIIGVAGNHDTDLVYQMKSVHWLEKQGPAEVKGLRMVGAPNTLEALVGIPPELYTQLEEDEQIGKAEDFINKYGTPEDVENFKKSNPVHKRLTEQLKGKTADMLITHKGIDSFAETYGYGAGLALWVKEKVVKKEPLIMLCGHEHGKEYYSREHGYQGLRSSNERAYIIHVNTKTKQIEQIDVYKKVYEKISKKEYEARIKAYDAAKNPKTN